MKTLFEQQGGRYEMQGDYRLPCIIVPKENEVYIGVWGERHRRYLKANHRVRYYNLLTSGKLNVYLAEVDSRAEAMFESIVQSLAEKENPLVVPVVLEKCKILFNLSEQTLCIHKRSNCRNPYRLSEQCICILRGTNTSLGLHPKT